MDKVFICSPYTAKTKEEIEENLNIARRFGRMAALQGFAPIIPHDYLTNILNDNIIEERGLGIKIGLNWLELVDTIWVCGDRISEGMRKELNYIYEKDLPINIMFKSHKELEEFEHPSIIEDALNTLYPETEEEN